MTIEGYMLRHDLSVAELAERVGVTAATVYRWLDGTRTPSARQMRAIYEATDRQVTPTDLIIGARA